MFGKFVLYVITRIDTFRGIRYEFLLLMDRLLLLTKGRYFFIIDVRFAKHLVDCQLRSALCSGFAICQIILWMSHVSEFVTLKNLTSHPSRRREACKKYLIKLPKEFSHYRNSLEISFTGWILLNLNTSYQPKGKYTSVVCHAKYWRLYNAFQLLQKTYN